MSFVREYYVGYSTQDMNRETLEEEFIFKLASMIIEDKGIICTAIFDGKTVNHVFIEQIEHLEKIMFPVFVQSDMEEILKSIEEKLCIGIKILFIGLPCQVEKLKNQIDKDYNNLITLTLKCKGVTSNKIFLDSLVDYQKESNLIKKVMFSNRKKYGSLVGDNIISFEYLNGEIRELGFGEQYLFKLGFDKGIILENNCYSCNSRKSSTVGDIFIGIYDESYIFVESNIKVIFIAINTEKGKEFFKNNSFCIEQCEKVENDILKNALMEVDYKEINQRRYFNALYPKRSFNEALYMVLNEQYDIGIASGYATSNFGGALTQYAMYQVLKDKGYSVYLVERPLNANHKGDFGSKFLSQLPYEDYELAPCYESIDEMVEVNKHCKMFLTGSDQFFNTYLYYGTKQFFSLNWVYDYKPKISYATSFGFDYLWDTEEQLAERRYYLKRFKKFSVREKSAVEMAKRELDLDVEWVLDPVFLCDRQHYESMLQKYNNVEKYNEKYIFAYILNPTPQKEHIIRKIQEDMGIPVIIFSDLECGVNKSYQNWSLKVRVDADLSEWLYAMKKSQFVITDSFHGTCFAMIFSKEFISIINRRRGATRFYSLAELFRIRERIVENVNDLNNIYEKKIDYEFINDVLKNEKERCDKWLTTTIEEALSCKDMVTEYDLLLKQRSSNNKIGNCRIFGHIGELGLKPGCSVNDIIRQMPNNSSLQQVQGAKGEPLIDTPVPYGILEIFKGTNYFIKVIFTQMTMDDKEPQIYQGKVKKQTVVEWERYITNREYSKLNERVQNLEKDIKFLIRHYAKGLED